MGVAVFATMLGLDHNPEWGRGRIAALILGVWIASGGALDYRYPGFAAGAKSKLESLIENHPLAVWIRGYLFTLPAVLLVLLAYVWFISAGLWTTWPPRTSRYALLATAFQNGELSLPVEPEPELLKLPNPYDPAARDALKQQGIRIPLDLSLYKGKFYLYFGPVPALILAALDPLFRARLGDLHLVFGFVCGLFLFQFLMVLVIWERFFRGLPKWLLLLSVLVVGLGAPSTFLLNDPSVYEAAISGGQFFLMGGFLAALGALGGPAPSGWRLALAGTLWALAIGTRLTLGVSVGFLVLAAAYWIFRTQRLPFDRMKRMLALVLPLILGAIGLGWYNWARFGSVLETGFFYSLSGTDLQKYHDALFSPAYILQNLYNYVLYPPVVGTEFPYFFPGQGNTVAIFSFYPLPAVYGTNPISGLIYAAPFAVFAIVPALAFISAFVRKRVGTVIKGERAPDFFTWVMIGLGGSSASAFFLLLIFFWAGMRYLGDFVPALVVLSVIGAWYGYGLLQQKPVEGRSYSVFAILMAATSIVMASLLEISGNIMRIQLYNPALLDWLVRIFPH